MGVGTWGWLAPRLASICCTLASIRFSRSVVGVPLSPRGLSPTDTQSHSASKRYTCRARNLKRCLIQQDPGRGKVKYVIIYGMALPLLPTTNSSKHLGGCCWSCWGGLGSHSR